MTKQEFVTMNTGPMRQYQNSSAEELGKLYVQAVEHEKSAGELKTTVKDFYYFSLIRDVLSEHYDIGELHEVYQIFGGYVNTTFGIYTMKDGERQTWLFRMYKKNKNEDSLKFEHHMLRHAKENGFTFGAAPIDNNEGGTYCFQMVETSEGADKFCFAVFNFIAGDVLYDWMPNWAEAGLADITIESGAQCSAQFHSAGANFDPQGLHGDNIMDSSDSTGNDLAHTYPARIERYKEQYAEAGLDSPFTEFVASTKELYEEMCEKCYIPPEDYAQMQINPCHCDGHGGNFKYAPDGRVVGSFDYDMSKVDSRLFDLAVSIHYLFASWKFATNGVIRLDRVVPYLKAYNAEVARIGKIPVLTELEKSYFYEAIIQATVYCTGWCTSAVMLAPDLNQTEYLFYAQHYAACTQWVKDNEAAIREVVTKI